MSVPKTLKTSIPDVILIQPQNFGDNRGYFFESWNKKQFSEIGIHADFIQDNESMSSYGVIRGLHYQAMPYTQAKLVRVIKGEVLDIAVDIRKNSPTFGKHVEVILSEENKYQLFIPRGFAHGFAVLSQYALFSYKCDNIYMPSAERGIALNDPELNIDWHLNLNDWNLSEKDRKHPLFKDAEYFN